MFSSQNEMFVFSIETRNNEIFLSWWRVNKRDANIHVHFIVPLEEKNKEWKWNEKRDFVAPMAIHQNWRKNFIRGVSSVRWRWWLLSYEVKRIASFWIGMQSFMVNRLYNDKMDMFLKLCDDHRLLNKEDSMFFYPHLELALSWHESNVKRTFFVI
jgi:hypothetical protein